MVRILANRPYCTAVVLAAGKGTRMGADVAKQYLKIENKPILFYTLRAFENSPLVNQIVLVVGDREQVAYCKKEILEEYGLQKVGMITVGGKERYDSVYKALRLIADQKETPDSAREGYVLIHDGARPLVTQDIIARSLDGAEETGACVVGMPVKDTIKFVDEAGFALSTPSRDRLWMIQTPQTFRFSLIEKAYAAMMAEREKLSAGEMKITDDAMVVETYIRQRVKLAEGSYENIKITTPEDMEIARNFLKRNLL